LEHFSRTTQEIEEKYRQLYELATRSGLVRGDRGLEEPRGHSPAAPDKLSFGYDTRQLASIKLASLKTSSGSALTDHADAALALAIDAKVKIGTAALETALGMTGIDFAPQLASLQLQREHMPRARAGRGGPFLSLASFAGRSRDSMPNRPMGSELAALERRVGRLQALKTLAQRLPLAMPIQAGWVSSDFGRRIDPLTGQRAFHPGVDIAGPANSTIYATADGTVTFAGVNGPYGRMIEIEHALGYRTRYGHLAKMHVKTGDRVILGQRIGIMGASGRTTGMHLHYEVMADEAPIDPSKFLKAGYHVFGYEEDGLLAP
jgi:murein DD-endopeptidase MepM/ murein hydrolase activator NlpD